MNEKDVRDLCVMCWPLLWCNVVCFSVHNAKVSLRDIFFAPILSPLSISLACIFVSCRVSCRVCCGFVRSEGAANLSHSTLAAIHQSFSLCELLSTRVLKLNLSDPTCLQSVTKILSITTSLILLLLFWPQKYHLQTYGIAMVSRVWPSNQALTLSGT